MTERDAAGNSATDSHPLLNADIFADGFESGDLGAWE